MSIQKENLISSYETLFICDLSQGEAAVKALVDKFIGLISENGTLTSVNEWGKRRLAYPINDLNEGYYVLATFNAPHAFPAELERIYKITEGIMRSMVIRTEDNNAEAITYESKINVEAVAEAVAEEAVAETVEEAPAAEEAVAENTEA